ncbi:hypothetical protein GWO43_17590 [candidate division KSB1 bacterium]|nr:hypothetical protein [candidate division KSB1 bacterium]NIV70407.1 hypothetical protein [Phycisphaerae bacterium]NIR71987.1 hypothetical protein [candidate division KSB1 bacterium]NIS24979.1 hypothetical protein [candidate division KSB1 bacterium]NIT72650.1 hypothetical protein [candidate division KSB1 bacterium]
MNVTVISEAKNLTKIRKRVDNGYYVSRVVVELIADKLLIEFKQKK